MISPAQHKYRADTKGRDRGSDREIRGRKTLQRDERRTMGSVCCGGGRGLVLGLWAGDTQLSAHGKESALGLHSISKMSVNVSLKICVFQASARECFAY